MDDEIQIEDTGSGNDLLDEIKQDVLKELESHDWLQRMRLRTQAFIQNNGIKLISREEVKDFLTDEAIRSFPSNVKQVVDEQMDKALRRFNLICQLEKAKQTELENTMETEALPESQNGV